MLKIKTNIIWMWRIDGNVVFVYKYKNNLQFGAVSASTKKSRYAREKQTNE